MTDLKTISVSLDASALDAMRAIQYGSEKIALVVSADNTLLGLVTDGDIRRGLLKGKDLNSSVEAFMNKSFSYLKENSSFAEAQKLMQSMEFSTCRYYQKQEKFSNYKSLSTM